MFHNALSVESLDGVSKYAAVHLDSIITLWQHLNIVMVFCCFFFFKCHSAIVLGCNLSSLQWGVFVIALWFCLG